MDNFQRQQLFNYRIKQLLTGLGIIHNAWNTRDQRRPTLTPTNVQPRVTEANVGGLLGHYLDIDKFGIQ